MSLWLTLSASDGASRRVGRNERVQRMRGKVITDCLSIAYGPATRDSEPRSYNSVAMNALAVLLLLTPQAQDEAHRAVYEKAVDSVVAVRAMAPLGERSGSGVVLSKDGFILTSYSTCPEKSEDIRVYLRGPRLLTGRIIGTSRE